MLPKLGLSEALIDPAIATLQGRGTEIRFNSRIAELTVEAAKITALRGPEGSIAIEPGDAVILAAPARVAADLLPK